MSAFLEKRKPDFKGRQRKEIVAICGKVGIVGAGMMGAEIGLCFAVSEVIIKCL